MQQYKTIFLKKGLQLLCLTAISLFLIACDNSKDEIHPVYQSKIYAFDTSITVTFLNISSAQADTLMRPIEKKLTSINQQWLAWHPGVVSAIDDACINRQLYRSESSVIQLLRYAQQLEGKSLGLFNPALGELVDLWGELDAPPTLEHPAPSAKQIDLALQHAPSLQDIKISGHTVQCHNPYIRLDFGGFAKGYGLHVLADALEEQGIKNALINAGGDFITLGQHTDRPWHIAIKDPFYPQHTLAVLNAKDRDALFTSSIYRQRFFEGKEYYHTILDPRTGYPANGFASVTVIDEDATLADAAAIAFLIAGLDDWHTIAKNLGVTKILMVGSDKTVYMTPEMQKQVHTLRDDMKLVVLPL